MKRAVLAVLVVACSDHARPEVKRDPERLHRVIEAPARGVRALPPHAIRADGVGPYRLGTSLAELLDQLPSGPRIAQFDIPGVVHRSILRAEDDAILIGGEPQGRASFVAVVGGEIARTESGIHVGSTRDELVRALGASVDEPDRARDPRVIVPSGLRNAHAVLDGDRVIALVVTADRETPRAVVGDAGAGDATCARPAPDLERGRFGACLTPTGELVAVDGDDIVVRGPDSERAIATARVPGMVFAAALRASPDGRDELVAIAATLDAQVRTWSLVAFRLEGKGLVKTVEPTPLYQLTVTNARWIGAELRDLDLYLELTSRPDAIEVGGLLTTRTAEKLHDIVVISSVPVARHRAKSAPPEATDAGTSDGASEGSATSEHHPRP